MANEEAPKTAPASALGTIDAILEEQDPGSSKAPAAAPQPAVPRPTPAKPAVAQKAVSTEHGGAVSDMLKNLQETNEQIGRELKQLDNKLEPVMQAGKPANAKPIRLREDPSRSPLHVQLVAAINLLRDTRDRVAELNERVDL